MRSFCSGSVLTRILILLSIPVSMLIDATYVHHSHQHSRRSPMGFQGVRGKRSVGDKSSPDPLQDKDNATNFQAPIPTPNFNDDRPTNGEEDNPSTDFLRGLPILSMAKRAPVGFMGMRGKKDYEITDNELTDSGGYFDDSSTSGDKLDFEEPRGKKLFLSLPYRYIPKRAPSGFMGMRGKKFNDDGSFKRAPVGFLGMRGKKGYSNPISGFDSTDNYMGPDQRADLEKLAAERQLLANLEQFYNYGEEKRAPANGFFGMRGKKLMEEYFKRAPEMGFHGMRGKKDDEYPIYDDFETNEEKRAPKMGFNGMRGKRQTDDFDYSRNHRFFFPDSASDQEFFEKRSNGFRGKFVGVRGKKDFDGQQMSFMSDFSDFDASNIKRAPSGFMGMRGKKSTTSQEAETKRK